MPTVSSDYTVFSKSYIKLLNNSSDSKIFEKLYA